MYLYQKRYYLSICKEIISAIRIPTRLRLRLRLRRKIRKVPGVFLNLSLNLSLAILILRIAEIIFLFGVDK
jgi:hypothetical protein